MSALHEALKTLGPADFSNVALDDLKPFFSNAFSNGQLIVDSVPTPAPSSNSALQSGRTRWNGSSSGASSESDISSSLHSLPPAPNIQALQKEWKSVKLNSKDNPLGISVYKVGSKDGRGAWFARRSVHDGLGFNQWKRALESEFHETMKVEGGPGEGNIRGIGGEKRIEHRHIDGVGKVEVYLLSAQFPGPTTPRDFVTMFITSDQLPPDQSDDGEELRHFMVISRPCLHKDTGPRDGYVRGHYESVEYIRELPRRKSPPLSTSTTELNDSKISEKSLQLDGSQDSIVSNETLDNPRREDKQENAVEWIMITRSDPGGSVPRFLVERGTPGGIVSDASKFLDWARSNDIKDLDSQEEIPGRKREEANTQSGGPISHPENERSLSSLHTNGHLEGDTQSQATLASRDLTALNGGGVPATTAGDANESVSHTAYVVSNQDPPSTPQGEQRNIVNNSSPLHRSNSSISSVSSDSSFASALEAIEEEGDNDTASTATTEAMGVRILDPKQLKKLELKKKKLDEKLNKAREIEASRRNDDSPKSEEAIRKAEEKHRKEVERLERKKHKEIRKVEEKKRKSKEKDEKSRILRELEDVRAEINVLKKEKEELRAQVVELQATNRALAEKTAT